MSLTTWPPDGDGDVVGPDSSTDGNLAVFDGTTGKLLKDGGPPSGGGIGGSSGTVSAINGTALASISAINGTAKALLSAINGQTL